MFYSLFLIDLSSIVRSLCLSPSRILNPTDSSHRERILNTLSKGESLSPDQIAALESGLEGYRAAEGGLSSSQYRAMADMISDLGDQYRRTQWHMQGWRGQRLLQLIEMLDYAAVVV